MSTEQPISLKSWGILILLSIIWGSSFILIKKALIAIDPVDVGLLRIVITTIAFVPVVFIYRKQIDWSKWKLFLMVGLTGSAIPSVLFAIAQTHVSSSVAGVLNSMTPIFTLILGITWFKRPLIGFQIIGIVFGFIGATLLVLGADKDAITGNILFGSLILLATFCYAFNVNAISEYLKDTKPIIISAVSFSLLGPLAGIYLAGSGFIQDVSSHEYGVESMLAVTFLALVGTAISTIIFFKLVQDTDAVFGSSVAFIIPIVALCWGVFDGEEIFFIQALGMVSILIGIYLIRKKSS